MSTVGKGLGVLVALFVAWCGLYPVLSTLGIERFRWNRYGLGGATVVFVAAALCAWMMIQVMIRNWLQRLFGLVDGPDDKGRGLRADFLEGVRIGLIAVIVCTILGLGLFFLNRWYMKT